MAKDVEMSDAGAAEAKQDSTEAPPKASPRDVLKGCVNLLNRAVKTKDVRVLPARALRQMAGVRRQTTSADIQAVATDSLATTCPLRDVVISTMQAEAKRDGSSASSAASSPGGPLPQSLSTQLSSCVRHPDVEGGT